MKRSEYLVVAAILIICLAGVGLAALPARAQTATPVPGTGTPQTRIITASGHGEVQAQPDVAVVRLGVQTDAETANGAVQANSQAMQKVLAAVRSAGLSGQDVQTEQLQLQARYDNPGEQGGTPQLAGYTASNVVRLTDRNISQLGSLLDAAVAAGANQIQGIQFQVSDPAPSSAQAREAAWRDAEAKATQLAGLAGAVLGDALIISESTQGPIPFSANILAAPAAARVPVEPGSETVSADVTVTWALTNGTASKPAAQATAAGTGPVPTAMTLPASPTPTAGATPLPQMTAPAASATPGPSPVTPSSTASP